MAAFPCPYCGHALTPGADASSKLERCPSCDGNLLIAYRYRLVEAHEKISGGQLYLALDDGFDERVAVLFVDDPSDTAAVERFIEGSSLFAEFGGHGLVKIHELGTISDRRPYVVMDWLAGGTLGQVVKARGALAQAALLELVSDLLTGLSKAHRSMPSVVHGHIHPGKIGFNRHNRAVLFGFEWATRFNNQTSHLADSFVTESERTDPRSLASDLRQLGSAFYYAATGEWLGDKSIDAQRARVRGQLSGPLGTLVDRMLGAGVDGYRSAVYAAIDFEQLMRGVDRWTAPAAAVKDRSEERIGAGWAPSSAARIPTVDSGEVEVLDDEDDDEDDEDDEDAEQQQVEFEAALARGRQARPPAAAKVDYAQVAATRQAESLRQAVNQAKPAASKTSGRVVVLAIGVMAVVGTCVAGIVADENQRNQQPTEFRPQPPKQVEAIPNWEPPAPPPSTSMPVVPDSVEPARAASALAGLYKFEGKITGPSSFAGVALDESCEVWVEPNVGELNCRWSIDCGEPRRRIYGGGTVGYSTCEVDESGRPVFAKDDDDDAPDGAFLANLNASDPMIVVKDRWLLPPVHVFISVGEGTLDPGPVPDVEVAPRLATDQVQAEINEGRFPTIEPGKLGAW